MDWTIRRLAHSDREAVLALWADRLGDEYPNEPLLDDALRPTTHAFCFVAVDSVNDIVGFALGRVLTPAAVATKLFRRSPPEWARSQTGLLDTNCVAKRMEGRGIGTALLARRLDAFRERGVTRVFAVSWMRDAATGSGSLLERAGFECVEERAGFWREDSLEQGYDCPDCGNPCTCAARIYVR